MNTLFWWIIIISGAAGANFAFKSVVMIFVVINHQLDSFLRVLEHTSCAFR